MISSRRGVAPLVISLLCSTLIPRVSALTAAYCSTLNTASTGKNSSIYQSNGLCHDFCLDDYAFAVLQDNGCWCSNYVPGTTVDTSECNEECPGYPDDSCGSKDSSLFEYLSLTLAASGTQAASTSASSTSSSQQPATVTETAVPVTVENTVTATPMTSASPTTSSTGSSTSPSSTSTSQATTTSSSSNTAKEESSSSTAATSTWTPTAVISVYTVTGKVMTVTMTPTTPGSSSETSGPSASLSRKKSSGLNTGQAVGLTVGLVALVALIGALVFLFLRRRKQATAEDYDTVSRNDSVLANAAAGGKPPSRSMSENSRYVLGTDGRQVVETWEPETRRSQLMPVDPRLNPFTPLYQRGDGSKSRDSVNTLRDDHDYSRRVHQQGPILRATNPDPDPDP